MAAMRLLLFSALLCCGRAMFKRDVRSVVGDEFPDLKGLSDTLAHAADSAKDVIQHGQEAVEGLKDLALDSFQAAAGKVNASLKLVGDQLREMNRTARKEIQEVDLQVKNAQDKCASFAAGAARTVQEVEPIFEQVVEKLQAVTKMAGEVLSKLHQEKASQRLSQAMEPVFAEASEWQKAMERLAKQLKEVKQLLASRSLPASQRNVTNLTEALNSSMLQMFPQEELSDALSGPMAQLSKAAGQLKSMAQQTSSAMSSFVDGALEAAKGKVPAALMTNVTEILKGVEAEARAELQPIGDIGQGMVDGLKQAGTDAGLVFGAAGRVTPCIAVAAVLLLSSIFSW